MTGEGNGARMFLFLRRRTVAAVLSCVFTLAAAGQQSVPDLRVWTATNGQTFKARLIGVEGGSGVFQLEDGRTTKVGLLYLSGADRTLISTGMKPPVPPPVAPAAVKPAPASPVGSPGKQPVW